MRNLTMKSILAAGALALAVASSSPVFGRGMHGGGGCGHDALLGGGRMLHALGLSTDQKQQVQDIVTAHRARLAPLAANENAARQALADKLLGAGTIKEQDLDALVQQEAQAHTALLHERLATALGVRKVLTAEQVQKAVTIRAGMKQLHAQMRQLLGEQGAK